MKIAAASLATLLACGAGPLQAATHQDFDNAGSAYRICAHSPGPPAAVVGEPLATDYSGRFLRLVSSAPSLNSALFEVERPGPERGDLDIDLDFRIVPQTGRGDGLGLALLRHTPLNLRPCLDLPATFAAEEPNFTGALGVGFDVHQDAGDQSDNHVSVHLGGTRIAEVSAGSLDLARGSWIHARITVRAQGADSRLTIVLKPLGGGPPRLVVDGLLLPGFHVYPWRLWIGSRAASASATTDVDNVHAVATGPPELDGRFDPAAFPFPSPDDRALPIHAHLLPSGQVMFSDRHDYTPPGDHAPRLWDPATNTLTELADPGYDIFCAGHALRADGKLFVAGGHIEDFNGEPHASTYDLSTNSWEMHPNMNAGRWYPTVTTLADGTMLVFAGSFFDAAGQTMMNDLPQVFEPAAGRWRDLVTARSTDSFYPFLYVAPNGKVFDAGPRAQSRYLDTAGTGAWSAVATSAYGTRNYGSSALYGTGRIVIAGGSPPDLSAPPTNTVETIDLTDAAPAWRAAPPMGWARRQHTATVLPDGTVLVTGGSSVRGHSNWMGAVYHPELWSPDTRTWRPLAAHREARLYHSISLLLPDARVLVAGGGHPRDEANAEPDHFDAEVFSPPYLFAGARPAITSAPPEIAYGEVFEVRTDVAAGITAVSLVRPGSVTHGFDENQRFVALEFAQEGAGLLQVHAPATAALAPPGHYMLFVLRSGVPSVARIVHLGGGASAASARAPAVPEPRPRR